VFTVEEPAAPKSAPVLSFKVVCPSCEAFVSVRDRSLIGKKIDCPKCKYRFVVEDDAKTAPPAARRAAPAPKPKPKDDDSGEFELTLDPGTDPPRLAPKPKPQDDDSGDFELTLNSDSTGEFTLPPHASTQRPASSPPAPKPPPAPPLASRGSSDEEIPLTCPSCGTEQTFSRGLFRMARKGIKIQDGFACSKCRRDLTPSPQVIDSVVRGGSPSAPLPSPPPDAGAKSDPEALKRMMEALLAKSAPPSASPVGTSKQNTADRDRLVPQPPPPPPAAPAPRFAPGDPVPGLSSWLLERPLGGGGFGEVWLAKHEWKPERRAVKFCLDPEARHRLVTHEKKVILRVMKHTDNHPNIVPLLEHNLSGETPWLMYEFVEGGTLAEAIGKWKMLPTDERIARAVRTLRALANALGRFHQLNPPIVHRDLKPHNVLMAGDVPRINDFGIGGVVAEVEIVKSTRAHTTNSARLPAFLQGAGTRLYAPPEQLDGSPPHPRDDVFALGVMAYQMLIGELRRAPGTDAADQLRSMKVPGEFVSLVTASVANDPDRRPKDASEWEGTLKNWSPNAAPAAPQPPTPAARVPETAPRPVAAPSTSGPINLNCVKCLKRIVVPRSTAGKQIKCPYCAIMLLVPAGP
jgi:transposase-like protein